jgi:hypothetical protein
MFPMLNGRFAARLHRPIRAQTGIWLGAAIYLNLVVGRLKAVARRYNALIAIEYPVGDKVPNGGELLRILGCDRHLPESGITPLAGAAD